MPNKINKVKNFEYLDGWRHQSVRSW